MLGYLKSILVENLVVTLLPFMLASLKNSLSLFCKIQLDNSCASFGEIKFEKRNKLECNTRNSTFF